MSLLGTAVWRFPAEGVFRTGLKVELPVLWLSLSLYLKKKKMFGDGKKKKR